MSGEIENSEIRLPEGELHRDVLLQDYYDGKITTDELLATVTVQLEERKPPGFLKWTLGELGLHHLQKR